VPLCRLTELGRVNIGQFGSITISSTSQLLLIIVVVTRGQTDRQLIPLLEKSSSQITENEFRNHDSFLLVHLDRDTFSVVHDRNLVLLPVNCNFDHVHRGVVDLEISTR
jgi:hypothetical protein